MSSAFPETLRALRAERSTQSACSHCASRCSSWSGWVLWLFFALITVSLASQSGQITNQDAPVITSPDGGRLAALHAQSGQLVRQGDLLFEIVGENDWRQRIRAPADGQLQFLSSIAPGVNIQGGAIIGVVLPADTPRYTVAALFPPATLSRIQPDMRARVYIDDGSGLRLSYLPATVVQVAPDTNREQIRVLLALDTPTPQPPHTALRYGQPVQVVVAVEQVSPLVLALRAAGQLIEAQ
ncbi:MAG: HlyD family efflux transporter periplasmic adaptor subunit [Chloroflexaceae bacterium]|nr:HlyD family efflux transporter periplasmic adaptor subunit [Chloroflexaceae bacterium]